MKRHSLYISALLALALTGCQREELQDGGLAGDVIVRFSPSIVQTEAQTKGTLINENGSGAVAFDTGSTFYVTAWDNAATPANIIPGTAGSYQEVKMLGTRWNTVYTDGGKEYAKEYLWKKDETKTFYAYANLPTATGAASVSCTSAAGQTLSYNVTKVTSAATQTDILLGYYKGDGKTGSTPTMTGTAEIVFSHPLAAVQFKLGTLKDVSTFAVNGISIEGVYASGEAEMTPTSAAQSAPKDRFSWTATGSTTVKMDPVSPATTLSVDATSKLIEESFLLIPQSFASTSTARIVMNVTIDGTKTTNLYYPLASVAWTAGSCYTYTVGFDGNTDVYKFDADIMELPPFVNTTAASSTVDVTVSSTLKKEGESPTSADWLIKSVKVGSANAQTVNATSFSDIGGISASRNGDKLQVKASKRTPLQRGSHDYWTNKGGISGDTDGTGWSPKDWSTTRAKSTAPLDLSMFDFQTEETTTTMTTANCYIIRHAGTYKIPLVYGNAIVGGNTNSQAYYPNVTGGTSRLARFQNHLGNGIIDPFIENNTDDGKDKSYAWSYTYWDYVYNSYLSAATAEIVWEESSSSTLITGVEITGDVPDGHNNQDTGANKYTTSNVRYVQFTVDPDTICQGNAIIAVKDGTGEDAKIMWSWHIWVTNDPALLTGSVNVQNAASNDYDFFPIGALGLIEGDEYPALDPVTITLEQKTSGKTIEISVEQPEAQGGPYKSVYYQWGRKDPMRSTGTITTASDKTTLAGSILSPDVFIAQSSGDWCSTTYYNLWTGKASAAGATEQGENLIKTVYDPSPVGYKVPAGKAFTGFTTKTDGSRTEDTGDFNVDTDEGFDRGWHFYTRVNKTGGTIFFPAAQYRNNNGLLINSGAAGTYWTADSGAAGTGGTTDNGTRMSFDKSQITTYTNASRAMGNSVRPVEE